MKKIKKCIYFSFLLTLFSLFTFNTLQAQSYVNAALHSQVTKVQPMTGIVFWSNNTSNLNSLGNKVQLEYSYLVYSDVVQNQGQYNWTVVDNLLSTAAARGRQVILRFRYTYPGEDTPSVPNYIRNRSDYTDQYENVEGQNTYIPDWSNTELQNFTLEFFTEFANRYDDDARLAFVQVGFGSYSEYHLYSGPLSLGQTFPSKAYQNTFLLHANGVFDNTQWSLSIDAASSTYSPIAASNTLLNLNYGLFDDSFLHETHSTSNSEYNRASWLTFGSNRANTKAAGGELNYYSPWDQEHVLDVQGPYGFTFEEMSEMYDITYMIGNDQLAYQSANRIEDCAMATGYHYEVTQYTTNGSSTQLTIKNNGIAPIYYDAYPAIGNIKSGTSLKGLTAGQSRNFTINTGSSGEDLTISCNRLVSGQEIQFDADIDSGGPINNTFTPDPNKTYYIDSSVHNVRLAATGESEDAYTTNINTTGNDVEWKFVAKGNGYWHLQRAAGGTKPRLRTDNSANADMQPTGWSGSYTYYEITEGALNNTYFLTLPDAPANYKRLQINSSDQVKMVSTASAGTWESFTITEVTGSTTNIALNGTASQSSNYSSTLGLAGLAIDGNTNGKWGGRSVTHTQSTSGSWWQVDLNQQTNIGEIVIYNRTDNCCMNRLSNFTVTVINSNGNTVFTQNVTQTPNPSTSVNANGSLGDTVRITNNLTNTPTSLAEVEVYTVSSKSSTKNTISDESVFESTIYPNPFNDELNIAINNKNGATFRLLDLSGKEIRKETLTENTTIRNLGNLAKGIYLLQILNTDNQIIEVKKLIKTN